VTKNSGQYRVIGLGLDYPSVKDGKRRFRATGDVIDDLPSTEIQHLIAEEQIEKVTDDKPDTGDVSVGAEAAEAASVIPEEG